MTDEKPKVPLVDNLHAPELYASEIAGFSVASGNIALTLASVRASWNDEGAPNRRVVVGRLVLPIPAAQALAIELYNFLKNHGLDPAGKPEGTSVQ